MVCVHVCRGTHHQNQSDLPFTLPDFMLERVKSNEAQFPSQLDRNTAYALNMELCHAFLRRHLLKGLERQSFMYQNFSCVNFSIWTGH